MSSSCCCKPQYKARDKKMGAAFPPKFCKKAFEKKKKEKERKRKEEEKKEKKRRRKKRKKRKEKRRGKNGTDERSETVGRSA